MVLHSALIAAAVLTLVSAQAGTSGQDRLARIRTGFAEVEADAVRLSREIDDLVRVRFDVSPALVKLGERVVVTVEARAARAPNAVLEVVEDCYLPAPRIRQVTLRWRLRKTAAGSVYRAVWSWRPPAAGNCLVRWRCNIGGDVDQFERHVGVVDQGSAVVILNSTSHASPRPEPDFHELHLPFSYWAEPLLFGRRSQAEAFAAFSRNARQFGDDPGLLIFLGGASVPGDRTVFCDEPPEVRKEVLRLYRRLWGFHRFDRPATGLYTYGLSNAVAREARQTGFTLLGALCADQNWGDGPFKINHWGMPASPYFVAEDDFRRAGIGGAAAMVGVQQCARHPALCRDYNCVFAFEGGIAYALDQYHGVSSSGPIDDSRLSRERRFLDSLVSSARQSPEPFMFSCGFEFNGVWPDTARLNRRFMEHIRDRARSRGFVPTTAEAAAAYLRRHHGGLPETVAYLPDPFDGLTYSGKPAVYPDMIDYQCADLRATFRKPDPLPYAQYDYSRPWHYPDWGNEGLARKPNGYLAPDTPQRFDATPKMVDTRDFEVDVRAVTSRGAVVVRITVRARREQRRLALAVWDLPALAAGRRVRIAGARRVVTVRPPTGASTCAVVIADVHTGKNAITLTIAARPE